MSDDTTTQETPGPEQAPEDAPEVTAEAPEQAAEVTPEAPEQSPAIAALAAECAARTEEVAAEQAARQAAHKEADAAFGVELDADTAVRRQSGAPAYADTWRAQIFAYCDEATAIIKGVA